MGFKEKLKEFLRNRDKVRLSFEISRNSILGTLAVLFLVSGIFMVCRCPEKSGIPAPVPAPSADSSAAATRPPAGGSAAGFLTGEVKPNQGLFQAVTDMGIATSEALKVINVLRVNVELIAIRAGEKVQARLSPDNTRILQFIYEPNTVTDHILTLDTASGEYIYSVVEQPTEIRYRVVEGILKDGSTLDQTLLENDVPANLTGTVNGILMCKISFRTHARKGDKVRVLLRERFYGSELIDGNVMYASYDGKKTGFYEAFRYFEDDPKSSYNAHYTENGEALIHSGLRYPLDRLHISSSFGMREHPVTGRRQMHFGVDYSAPPGTQVHAVAKGTVVLSSFDEYSGNKVAIRHSDGSSSWYLHLRNRSVRKGQQVKTRQVIGTVGSTGRTTGPHLHFAFKNPRNAWINPLNKRMIATPKLAGARLARLRAQVFDVRQKLKDIELYQDKAGDTLSFAEGME